MNSQPTVQPLASTTGEKTEHQSAAGAPASQAGMPEELLTIISVMKARGCKSRTTIWNEIRDGTFPPPDMVRKRIRYWRASTLRKWQDDDVGVSA